ncbi:hypothetical protein Tco_1270409, partial [Tanacetum coccineum]
MDSQPSTSLDVSSGFIVERGKGYRNRRSGLRTLKLIMLQMRSEDIQALYHDGYNKLRSHTNSSLELYEQSGTVKTRGQSSFVATIENIQVDGNANVESRPFNTTGQRDCVIPNCRVVTRDNMMSVDERKRSESLTWRQRRRATAHYVLNQAMTAQNVGSGSAHNEGVPSWNIDVGDCECSCEHCGASFWYGERLKGYSKDQRVVHIRFTFGRQKRNSRSEGNAIQENMGIHYIPYFSSLLQDGSAYMISGFMCIPTSNFHQTLETKTTLRYIGCITQVGNFQTLRSATTNQINIKKLDIENL